MSNSDEPELPGLGSPELPAARRRLESPELGASTRKPDRQRPITGRRKASVARYQDYEEVPDSCDSEGEAEEGEHRSRPITGRRKASVARYQDYEEVPDSCDSEGEAEEGEHAAEEDEHAVEEHEHAVEEHEHAVEEHEHAVEEDEHAVEEDEHAAEQENSTVKKTSEKKTSGKKTGANPRIRSSNLTDAQWTVIVSTDQTQLACSSADCLPFYSVMHSPMAWSTPPKTTTRKSIAWLH
jgi:hypothetical protein